MDTLRMFFWDVLALTLISLGGMIIAESRRLTGFAWGGAVAVAMCFSVGGLLLLRWAWGM